MATPAHSLVTGANRGLGLALVRGLLARGDRVVATARHPGKATALNTLTGQYPGRLHVLPLDVASEKSRDELARELPLVLDGASIDLMINNAGVLHSGERWGKLHADILEDSLRINAIGPLLLVQAVEKLLADGARVANISTQMASFAGRTEFRSPSYSMSKAAQNMATVQLALALKPRGITVVALSPGWVRTDMGGAGGELAPEESAAGLLETIAGLGDADSGRFLDWRGQPMAW
ncbi:Short-chain dehydrogenase/reductase SDR [Lysobacter dokdonensis DS-58]|uniref:Short-chain dehydrogenase/reductase SDR n=1 Tax=Lysobacter dokdonensis DS-58 TaxID=1300345 RepID=A0A0A2WK76_9GAMM|nr:SDR family oxidoreductase [Lysobacter dokdonensis]KGQ20173.1 Short-chain dehydrogenase/reductase SDR [Lysobacter dokdonensis DS-58]